MKYITSCESAVLNLTEPKLDILYPTGFIFNGKDPKNVTVASVSGDVVKEILSILNSSDLRVGKPKSCERLVGLKCCNRGSR